jgi:hypothetical protein
MMSISTDDLVKIVEAGGGVTFDAEAKTKDELVRIATAAAQFDATVTFRNVTSLSVDDLVEIAKAGDGWVIFEM